MVSLCYVDMRCCGRIFANQLLPLNLLPILSTLHFRCLKVQGLSTYFLLFQTGYSTILSQRQEGFSDYMVKIGTPNHEVTTWLENELYLSLISPEEDRFVKEYVDALLMKNTNKMKNSLTSLFDSVFFFNFVDLYTLCFRFSDREKWKELSW